jgi:predicted ester cyclase
MPNQRAIEFAKNSFIKAFEPNDDMMLDEQVIEQYFHKDLVMYNHSVSRSYTLEQIKLSVLEVFKKYQGLTSELKDVIVEGDRIAFRVTQYAYFLPEESYVVMDVMNLYTLANGKVKNWRLWFTQDYDEQKNDECQ